MNKKIEKWIREFAWKGMIMANNINKRMGVDLGEKRLTKWLDRYIKFLDITFKFITGATISLALVWFFPIYLKIPYERMTLIVLVIILLQLRFGEIKVKI
jgi:uncharacterized membrane protein YoaK (UPF0700 family)